MACISRECQDPCQIDNPCGRNAECSVNSHRAVCNCIPQHKGNPYVECLPYECLQDPDCPTTQKCEREVCVDPCRCAKHATCRARNHRGICTCEPNFTGDPYGIECEPSKWEAFICTCQLKIFILSFFQSKSLPLMNPSVSLMLTVHQSMPVLVTSVRTLA